jgi:hypothetical protein
MTLSKSGTLPALWMVVRLMPMATMLLVLSVQPMIAMAESVLQSETDPCSRTVEITADQPVNPPAGANGFPLGIQLEDGTVLAAEPSDQAPNSQSQTLVGAVTVPEDGMVTLTPVVLGMGPTGARIIASGSPETIGCDYSPIQLGVSVKGDAIDQPVDLVRQGTPSDPSVPRVGLYVPVTGQAQAVSTPAPPPPPPPSSAFDPTSYIGQGNRYNCKDFANQAQAQAVLRADPTDPNKLDSENDGIACETNPAPYDRFPVPH